MIAASVALIAVGSLSGAYLYVATGHRTGVLAMARDVPPGATITAEDLIEAKISSDPALKPIPAEDLKKVVGKRAVSALPAGSLLTERSITSAAVVGPGQQLVAVSLDKDRVPATALTPGQKVQLVHTPKDSAGAAGQGGAAAEPNVAASVVRVGKAASSGDVVVDVAVASTSGTTVARWAARGEVSFLVLPEGG
ncbi:SAF domain-containing protein [Kitasatospora sp. NPDC049258]|uniref:SAF domain-containing protein n=1 Tax=Kitasatospora sp. NPDC049258 TaxID=3155394 RepID=UPI0034374BB2